MNVLKFPLAKITLFFVLGIFVAKYFTFEPKILFLSLFFSFLGLMISYLKQNQFSSSFFGILVLFLSFQIGFLKFTLNDETLDQNHFTNQISEKNNDVFLNLEITEKLKSSDKNFRFVAEINSLNNRSCFGKIILNIHKSDFLKPINIGSNLSFQGSIYKNKKSKNPDQFNYSEYLENKQIYGQVFVDASDVKISTISTTSAQSIAENIRNKIIKRLQKSHFRQAELNVIIALILGQQQEISPDLMHDYQFAGAIHVLSVSGLHVGLILLFINFLLKPFPNTKRGALLKLALILFSLWSFGILAGMSPCILRSVVMFSFVAIGNHLRRTVNFYHTMLVSMFLILLFDPSYLFDVGFQLSYLALFFIVWLQPLFKSIYSPKSKILIHFWDIITVSFAAQIGTLPLSIYYFHQFPGLFFVTNLIVLPLLTFVIMPSGILLIICAAFDFVPNLLVFLVQKSIWLLNSIISWVASFEDFIFKDIPFTKTMMIVLYLGIISWIIWAKKPTFKKLIWSFCFVIVFQTILVYTFYSKEKESEFVIFSKHKTTIICQRFGKKVTLFANDTILKSIETESNIKSYLVANFSKIDSKKPISDVFYFKGKSILIFDKYTVYNNEKPDVIVLINSPKLNLERLLLQYKPKQIVVDGSNYKSYVKLWKSICEQQKIPFHDTSEKGFYKL